jgi:molecular chaperone GrpE
VEPKLNSTGGLEDDIENTGGQEANSQAVGMSAAAGAELPRAGRAEAAPPEGEASANAAEADGPDAGASKTRARRAAPEARAPETAAPHDAPATGSQLTEIVVTLREIAGASERYHTRAQQREGVIEYLRTELDLLRRGERRGVLRPVLADLCRLRDDLLKQAATLPGDFDAAKAAELLQSYAETIELTLESNGVITFAPESGDPFDPRMHRRVSGEAATDPALAGRIAEVQRDGYLDIESTSPIAPAEVTVFAAMKGGEQ